MNGGYTAAAGTAPSIRTALAHFLLDTKIGNLVAIVGLAATYIGLAWAVYTGVVSLLGQRWTKRNDILQSCAALYSIGKYSDYCNATLEAGVRPSRFVVKRHASTVAETIDDDTSELLALAISLARSPFWGPTSYKPNAGSGDGAKDPLSASLPISAS